MSGQVIFFIRHAHGEHNAVMEVGLKAYYKAHPVSPSTAAPTEFPSAAMGALRWHWLPQMLLLALTSWGASLAADTRRWATV